MLEVHKTKDNHHRCVCSPSSQTSAHDVSPYVTQCRLTNRLSSDRLSSDRLDDVASTIFASQSVLFLGAHLGVGMQKSSTDQSHCCLFSYQAHSSGVHHFPFSSMAQSCSSHSTHNLSRFLRLTGGNADIAFCGVGPTLPC